MPSLPRRELAGDLILKVLKVNSLEALDRQWEPKISHRERGAYSRESRKNIVEVNVATSNGSHQAFGAVCNKTGHFSKGVKAICKELNVLLN